MVVYTTRTFNGIEYDYAYSDEGRYLVSGSEQWEEVYAPLGSGRTFTEGELMPETEAYQGQTWVSIIDNNVWAPDVYGWEVVE